MNDIIAPIFAVYLAELFKMTYIELENNLRFIEPQLTPDNIITAEADTFFCFCQLLSTMKQNYIKGFDGINSNLNKISKLLIKCDKELVEHFEKNDVHIFHFAFRWSFCLLLREFPLHLSINLIDYYLLEDVLPNELCTFLIVALLLKFSFKIKTFSKEQIIIFLQSLPTQNWGEQDIKLLVSEGFTLRSLFKIEENGNF